MKSHRFFVTFLVGLFFVGILNAQTTNCSVANYIELVKCSEIRSKNLQITNQRLKVAEQLESAASQWINPELDIESVSRDSGVNEQSATLFFNLSLGGKRSAQINQARAEYDKAAVLNDFERQTQRLSLMITFYRLNHLQAEIKIEEESVATFSKVIKQYQGRSALSPEQDVSLAIFRMALADHQLNLVKSKSEYETLLNEVVISTELSKEQILKNLPKAKTNWPKIDSTVDTLQSPQVKLAQNEVALSKTQKKIANADSWPELKIGPTIKRNKQGQDTEELAGFSLSMPLPIFSWNGGAREVASQKIVESELTYDLEKTRVAALRKQLVSQYLSTTEILKTTFGTNFVTEKHEKIERQFFKGTVPSSLIIEAHRQLFDLESKRNESERTAIEALGQILIIDNKFSEVIL